MSRNFELLRRAQMEPLEIPERPEIMARPKIQPKLKPEPAHGTEWQDALYVLKKHRRLSAAFAAVVFLTVGIVTMMIKPVYEPTVSLQVDPPSSQIYGVDRLQNASSPEYLETQKKNLEANTLALEVIRSQGLDKNSEFVSNVSNPTNTNAVADGQDKSVLQLTPGENAALSVFGNKLTVKRDTSSRLISVSFKSYDPVLAARVANTLVDTYVQNTYKARRDAITEQTKWLTAELDDIKNNMEQSNKALSDFQKATGIADIDSNKNTVADQMGEMNKQVTQAQMERIQLGAFLKGNIDALPQVHNNLVVQSLTQKLAEARTELAQNEVIYGKNHPVVKKLQSQISELQHQLDSQKAAIISELKTSYTAARARQGMIEGQMKNTSKELNQLAEYNSLKKETEANTNLYNSLYAKVKEAGISASTPPTDIRIVDRARVLTSPTWPNRPLNLAIGLFAGLIGGIVLAFVRERFDNRLHTADEIKRWTGISRVSIVPALDMGNGSKWLGFLPSVKALPESLEPFVLTSPQSPEAEALRGLETSILMSRQGKPPQVLLIASSFPGEGKTTVAVNLAITLARHGSTCIVDADLRRPKVSAVFGLDDNEGLSEVLSGLKALDDVFTSVESAPNLTLLPAGPVPRDPGHLICSSSMQSVIQTLRTRFEFVVIDCAPILPYADGRALSTNSDGVVFVGRSGVTTQSAMVRAMELLNEMHGAPVIEVVLNGATEISNEYKYYKRRYAG